MAVLTRQENIALTQQISRAAQNVTAAYAQWQDPHKESLKARRYAQLRGHWVQYRALLASSPRDAVRAAEDDVETPPPDEVVAFCMNHFGPTPWEDG